MAQCRLGERRGAAGGKSDPQRPAALTLCGEHNKIILYAKPGTQSFYLKLGFLPMNTAMGLWRHPTRACQTGILSGAQVVDASSASP